MERNTQYDFPPPRNTPRSYIDEEHHLYIKPQDKWAYDYTNVSMPEWMMKMLQTENSSVEDINPCSQVSSVDDLQRQLRLWRSRAFQLHDEKKKQEESNEEKLAGTKRKLDEMRENHEAELEQKQKEVDSLKKDVDGYKKKCEDMQDQLIKLKEEKGAQPLRYVDLYEGGILSKFVSSYTLFSTVELNDAWLELINFADGTEGAFPEGDGLCENLRAYSSDVKMPERKGEQDPPSLDPNSKEYQQYLKRRRAKKDSIENAMTWKDDYLAFNLYIRCGMTQKMVAGLCGISEGRMSDIFHEWAQVMDDALQEMFPRPTRSQMLRVYPSRFIEADGHARCFLLLDAFELFVQQATNPNVSSSTHSDYKLHNTSKHLGGTDPVGCAWKDTVSDGGCGKGTDVMLTEKTQILRQIPFGHTGKVDKGFIVDDLAAAEGVVIDRPQKKKEHQVQQSTVDTSQTQKIGNTRIFVECVNGSFKLQIRYLNVLVPTLQFGILSKIVRIGYLLQNFKKALIHERGEVQPNGGAGRLA